MTDALGNPPRFGGQPGEPVPEVDPMDLRATWEFHQKLQAERPGVQVATGTGVAEALCRPGADIQAVGYRSMIIWIFTRLAPEQIAPYLSDGQPTDAIFCAAAKVPLEWSGVGIAREGLPFDGMSSCGFAQGTRAGEILTDEMLRSKRV